VPRRRPCTPCLVVGEGLSQDAVVGEGLCQDAVCCVAVRAIHVCAQVQVGGEGLGQDARLACWFKVGRNTVTSGGPVTVTVTEPIPCYLSREGLFYVCMASGNQRRSCYRSQKQTVGSTQGCYVRANNKGPRGGGHADADLTCRPRRTWRPMRALQARSGSGGAGESENMPPCCFCFVFWAVGFGRAIWGVFQPPKRLLIRLGDLGRDLSKRGLLGGPTWTNMADFSGNYFFLQK